jgi:hypothetical protein
MVYLEMDMIELVFGHDMYYNTVSYFRSNILENLPNDDKAWTKAYQRWIKEQGATVLTDDHFVLTLLGVAPGHSKLQFQDKNLSTLFVLRWA